MKRLTWIVALTVLLIVALPAAARADYSFDGFPLQVVQSGTINGELFVDGGHGLAANDAASPYIQSFQVPAGQVTWARLYVGVWGGNPDTTGTLNISFNDSRLGTAGIGKNTAPGIASWVDGATYGCWWVAVDVTGKVDTGSTNKASLYTANGSDGWDGRIYGAILVAALKQDHGPAVSYAVAEGNEDLNYKTPLDTTTVIFPGSFSLGDGMRADLTTVCVAGSEGAANSLYCNSQLVSALAADGGGRNLNGEQWEDRYLDLDHWDITDKLASKENRLTFARRDTTFLDLPLMVLRSLPQSEASALIPGQGAPDQTPAFAQDAFTDIQHHWARAIIDKLARAGLVSGFDDHTFHPEESITRAQFAALLVKALSLTTTAGVNPTFQDVPASYWGYQAVETATAYGLIDGSNGNFYPDRNITHQEMAVLAVRAAGLEDEARRLTAAEVDNLLALRDKDQISSWAAPYVAMAVKNGFVKGLGGAFNPLQPATRAEAAVMINNLTNYQKK